MPMRASSSSNDHGMITMPVTRAAEAAGVSTWQVRQWCAQWCRTAGRDGLRHSRPAARLILIFPADLSNFLLSRVPRS
jgi:hypothetical protein